MGRREDENIKLVKKFYEYLESGDRDGAYENTFAEDCVLHETDMLPYGGIYRGRDLMKETLAGVMAGFDLFECKIHNYLAGDDEVVVHLTISGVGRKSRRPFSVALMELWRIRDGKAIELRPFLYNPAAIVEALV